MTKKLIPGGLYLTLDGQDFTGKSTQARLLGPRLSEEFEVYMGREPGGTRAGERIRDLLLDPSIDELDDIAELLLYNAARSVLFSAKILPSLAAGKVALVERGKDATEAYQGHGPGRNFDIIYRVAKISTRERDPNLTFIFDMDLETRLGRKGSLLLDRIEQKQRDYQQRVAEGFRQIAKRDSNRCVLINAARSLEEIHEEIYRITKERIDRALANQ